MRPLRPLTLSLVNKTSGDIPNLEDQKRLLAKLYDTKQRSCCYCGHFSPILRGLEIDHLNGDHGDFSEDNLELACHWCHAARHLEFALQAGAVLVQWDFPQDGISRLTLQAMQTTYLRAIYDDLVVKGVGRREHNYPDGHLGGLDLHLRAQLKRGDYAGANTLLTTLQADGIRLAFPRSYLNSDSPPPPAFEKTEWSAICGYYRRLQTNVLIDNERRATLAIKHRKMRQGITESSHSKASSSAIKSTG
jgi:hypothetical protein